MILVGWLRVRLTLTVVVVLLDGCWMVLVAEGIDVVDRGAEFEAPAGRKV